MGAKMIFHIAYITNGKRNDFIKVESFEDIRKTAYYLDELKEL